MKIIESLPDDAILRELGARLAAARLARNLTQAGLAEAAGVGKRTVERLESGQVAARLSAFVRVCLVLGLADRLDALVPQPRPGPMELLNMQGRSRRRARGKGESANAGEAWTWGTPS